MLDLEELATPYLQNVGPAGLRNPQTSNTADILPAGFELISADDHWEPTSDIFYDRVPEHLKSIAPRVWFDRFWRVMAKTEDSTATPLGEGENIARILERSIDQSGWSRERRAEVTQREGIKKAIVFPNSMLAWCSHPNVELRELVFRIYNEAAAAEGKAQKGFYPVAVFANWWDPDKAQGAMDQIVDLGFKTFMIPFSLKDGKGRPMNCADPIMENFWTVVEKSGLPLGFHVGESANFEGRGGAAVQVVCSLTPFRRVASQLIFGGVFDRHPKLRIAFSEGGISWIAPFLQDCEMVYDTYGDTLEPIKHRPSYYWHKHCYATFQNDRVGLTQLHLIGADRVMWGSDYPHSEGTFGYTREAIKDVLAATSEAEARLILGDTARQLYRLD